MKKNKVLDCPVYLINEEQAKVDIKHFIDTKVNGYFVAINAEKIYRYRQDKVLRNVIDNALYPYPDGAGAVLSGKLFHNSTSEKINMPTLALDQANEYHWRVFIYGAKADIHSKAVTKIKQEYPNIDIVGNLHGYQPEEEALEQIRQSEPQIVMLALGSPRQEYFAYKCTSSGAKGLFIGCGGALDIISGNINRAPEFFINNGLEWFYRLVQEPWRWKRQLVLFQFAYKVISTKLANHLRLGK